MTEPTAGRAAPRAAGPAGRDVYFGLLAAVVCLEAVGIGVLFPLLAHVQEVHHLPTYTLGLMSGASFFAALLAQVCAGPLLDGKQAQRLLLTGVLLGAGSLVWFAFAGGLPGLVGSRALGGVGYGIVAPAALRQASVGVSGIRRGKRLGVLSSAQMAGFTLGPFFGSVLYAAGGLRVPFEVVAGLLGAVGLGVALLPARTGATARGTAPAPAPGPDGHPAASPIPRRARVLGPRWRRLSGLPVGPLVAVLVLGAAMQLPNGLYDSLWARMLTDRGASQLLIGLSLSFFGVPFIVLAPLGGRIAERRGPLLAGGLGLLAADGFMAAYGFVPWPVLIMALGVGEACVASVAIPGGFGAVARVFPDERIATGQGLFGGFGTVAAGAAAVAGAPVYAAFGGAAAFGGGAAVSALLVVAALAIGAGRDPGGTQSSAEQQVSTIRRVTT